MNWLQRLLQPMTGSSKTRTNPATTTPLPPEARVTSIELDIAPNDPLLAYILNAPGVIVVDNLRLDSPALQALRDAQVHLAVPLVSQGELIGLLNLGPRLSEAGYSSDDLRLLSKLATQAAPALRVAQLARQQQAEARQRERMEQELRVARVVQQTLLPQEVPVLDGWRITAHWQPASAVSGDFYDFISFPDGRVGFIVADVTDKGVPAALVMASSRSVLRSVAEQLGSPGAVLEQANDLLCPSMPEKMFVTCLYALLDPASGRLRYANAGHNPAFQHSGDSVTELRARGMPLGLMPRMLYEENETHLLPGDHIMMYSDGLVEAHDAHGEMFGYPRLRRLMAMPHCSEELIQCMLDELYNFTGPAWEQEDDVTFVTLERQPQRTAGPASADEPEQILLSFSLPSRPGEERRAIQQVAEAVEPLALEVNRLERLKTAVAEATMNAMEHGNRYQEGAPVVIKVSATGKELSVCITDCGGEKGIPEPEVPDLEAKLAGLQSPRGWGLFLIKSMVDDLRVRSDGINHTVELVLNLEEDEHESQ
jgi:serine phosphatase RsbU (regulator of sigma subunit)/anti-sigma regulatory factor (Ser/Thr protein kinase)